MKSCTLCLLTEYATVTGEWGDFHVWWQTGGGAAIQPASRDASMTSPGTVSREAHHVLCAAFKCHHLWGPVLIHTKQLNTALPQTDGNCYNLVVDWVVWCGCNRHRFSITYDLMHHMNRLSLYIQADDITYFHLRTFLISLSYFSCIVQQFQSCDWMNSQNTTTK